MAGRLTDAACLEQSERAFGGLGADAEPIPDPVDVPSDLLAGEDLAAGCDSVPDALDGCRVLGGPGELEAVDELDERGWLDSEDRLGTAQLAQPNIGQPLMLSQFRIS